MLNSLEHTVTDDNLKKTAWQLHSVTVYIINIKYTFYMICVIHNEIILLL